MKAAVLHEARQPMTIEDVGLSKPKRREVLVRTVRAGICHSDLHFQEGLYPYPLPTVLGHEAAGIVEQVGEDVTYVQPGDHVVGCLSVFCGECEQCLTGHPNLCLNTEVKLAPGAARRLTFRNEVLHQFMNLSAFAEQMVVHEHALVKIRPDMPLDRAALIGCGVITGVGAVFNTARMPPGSAVAVIGCGGIGLSCVNGAAMAGAARIIAIDRLPEKLETAKKLGATDVIQAGNTDVVAEVLEMTGGGVPYSFECLGLKETAEQSFRMLAFGGTATLIGMVPFGQKIELHAADLLRERRIQGCSMGSNRFRVDMPRLVEFYMQGRLHLDHLISGEMPLERINEGFDALRGGHVLRNLLTFA
ncbi:MAG: Zn-dependent alcohol dehydrogenase [Acidisphaera sp.]|nr:Zn-dependent alcohol dehydrogenase [Acidisphaera sp.]